MSRDIEAIINVTTYAVLGNDGKWSYNGSYMPTPDEIVIRQVTFSSTAPAPDLLLIKSNLGMIGSIVTSNFQSNPGTRIQVRDPISGPLEFQLFVPTAGSMFPAATTVGDMISIHMDFIKYRR